MELQRIMSVYISHARFFGLEGGMAGSSDVDDTP
jgi:hypothetical protein